MGNESSTQKKIENQEKIGSESSTQEKTSSQKVRASLVMCGGACDSAVVECATPTLTLRLSTTSPTSWAPPTHTSLSCTHLNVIKPTVCACGVCVVHVCTCTCQYKCIRMLVYACMVCM